MLSDKIKTTLYIIIACIAVVTTLFGIERYFAKEEEVKETISRIGERIDIGIIDDQIFQQAQEINRIQNLIIFERKEKEMTEVEKEVMKKNKEKLQELKESKIRKLEQHKSRK